MVNAQDDFDQLFGALRSRALQTITKDELQVQPTRHNEEKVEMKAISLSNSQRRIGHLRKLRSLRQKHHRTVISQIRTCASAAQVSLSQVAAQADLEDMAFARRLQQQSQTAARRLQELLFECAGEIEKVRLRATLHSASSIPVYQTRSAAIERERAWADMLLRIDEDSLGAIDIKSLNSFGEVSNIFTSIRNSLEHAIPPTIRLQHRVTDGSGKQPRDDESNTLIGSNNDMKVRVMLVGRVNYASVRERSRAADGSVCLAQPQSGTRTSSIKKLPSSGEINSSSLRINKYGSKLSASTNVNASASTSAAESTTNLAVVRAAVGNDAAKNVLGILSRRAGIHVTMSRTTKEVEGSVSGGSRKDSSGTISATSNGVIGSKRAGTCSTGQYIRRQHSETIRLPSLPACKFLSARSIEWMVPHICPVNVIHLSSKPLLSNLRVFYCIEDRATTAVSSSSASDSSPSQESLTWKSPTPVKATHQHKQSPQQQSLIASARVARVTASLLGSIYCVENENATGADVSTPKHTLQMESGTQARRSWSKTNMMAHNVAAYPVDQHVGLHRTLPVYTKAQRHAEATCEFCIASRRRSERSSALQTTKKKKNIKHANKSIAEDRCSCITAAQRLVNYPDVLVVAPSEDSNPAAYIPTNHDTLHFAPATVATLLESTELSTICADCVTERESGGGGERLTEKDAAVLASNYGIDLRHGGLVRKLYVLVSAHTVDKSDDVNGKVGNSTQHKQQRQDLLIELPVAAIEELIHAYVLRGNVVQQGHKAQHNNRVLQQQRQKQLYTGQAGHTRGRRGDNDASSSTSGVKSSSDAALCQRNSNAPSADAVWLWPRIAQAFERATMKGKGSNNNSSNISSVGHHRDTHFGLALVSCSSTRENSTTAAATVGQTNEAPSTDYLVAFQVVETKSKDNATNDVSSRQLPASRQQRHRQINHSSPRQQRTADMSDTTSNSSASCLEDPFVTSVAPGFGWEGDGPGPLCAWRSCLADAAELKHVAVETNVVLAYAVCSHHSGVVDRLMLMAGGLQEIKRHLGQSTGAAICVTGKRSKKQQRLLQEKQQKQQSERDLFGMGADKSLRGIILSSSLAHELHTHKLSATIAGFCVKAAAAARPKTSSVSSQGYNVLLTLMTECRGKQRESSLLTKIAAVEKRVVSELHAFESMGVFPDEELAAIRSEFQELSLYRTDILQQEEEQQQQQHIGNNGTKGNVRGSNNHNNNIARSNRSTVVGQEVRAPSIARAMLKREQLLIFKYKDIMSNDDTADDDDGDIDIDHMPKTGSDRVEDSICNVTKQRAIGSTKRRMNGIVNTSGKGSIAGLDKYLDPNNNNKPKLDLTHLELEFSLRKLYILSRKRKALMLAAQDEDDEQNAGRRGVKDDNETKQFTAEKSRYGKRSNNGNIKFGGNSDVLERTVALALDETDYSNRQTRRGRGTQRNRVQERLREARDLSDTIEQHSPW